MNNGNTLSLEQQATAPLGSRTIDCDAGPFVPDGWKVKEHKQDGKLTFDPLQIEFYLDDGQKGDRYIEGNKLRERLANKPVMNANFLDFLLTNPDLIPDEWKTNEAGNTRNNFFWGTIYHGSDGRLCVRCLCWGDGKWVWSYRLLDSDWRSSGPALVHAS